MSVSWSYGISSEREPLTDENMDGLGRFPLEFDQLFFHVPLQIPVRSFRSNIKQVLREMSAFTYGLG